MRLRQASPLLLLLLPAFAAADLESIKTGRLQKRDSNQLTKEEILELNLAKGQKAGKQGAKFTAKPDIADAAATSAAAKPSTSTRAYKGTEDAPVDGLDGKPHAGPFVDTTPEESTTRNPAAKATGKAKPRPTSLEKFAETTEEDGWRPEDIPEKNDGVMNDETRVAPKKGTTGTEGGISEKTKDRILKGDGEKKPQAPNEAPPLPHSEQERIAAQQGKTSASEKPKGAEKEGEKEGGENAGTGKKAGEYGAGGLGLEKPTDLPDKPHNMPHPDRKGSSTDTGAAEPPVGGRSGSGSDAWLQDTMPYTEGSTNPRAQKPPSSQQQQQNPTSAGSSDPATGITSPGTAGDMEWHEWFHSFVLSLTMIIFSEIGDKTFLVAALMAMRHPRALVFSAAFAALVAMTVLSAVLGHALPSLLPKRLTTFGAACLFLVFGARLLREGLAMAPDEGVADEMREVEAELEEKDHHRRSSPSDSDPDPHALESGRPPTATSKPSSSHSPSRGSSAGGLTNLLSLILSPAWVQTFVMTFLGEWGDRSQIATIAMAAGQDYWWVTLGACAGHAVCTGVAVVGGRALAGRVSMRVVTIGGALAFLAFGLIYLYECFAES